jgi:hypothetical protein
MGGFHGSNSVEFRAGRNDEVDDGDEAATVASRDRCVAIFTGIGRISLLFLARSTDASRTERETKIHAKKFPLIFVRRLRR